jgi:leucine dehydrogenase
MLEYDDSRAALRDVLRLARAMTYKAAVADLPLGGGKGVIMLPEHGPIPPERRRAALLDFADTVQALGGRYITAEDVGTSSRDMAVIAERTGHVVGLARSRGGSGDPSPLTALGVEYAIRACCQRVFGSDSLRGRTIGVLGLGHVGSRLAKRCQRAGAKLVVSDVTADRRRLADQLGARWIAPEHAVAADVEILAPCALGGLLDEDACARLRCRIVAGAANNQLADDSVADTLAGKGILWAPDFVVNAGGLINIAEELGGYEPAAARKRVRGIADTLLHIFAESESMDATPLTAAMELARRRLAAASAARG